MLKLSTRELRVGPKGSWQALVVATMLALGASHPGSARAGGVELPSAGTRALGRGGAAQARADDPMTLFWNPAGLGRISGIQLSLQSHLIFYDACFDRTGTYGAYGTDGPINPAVTAPGYTGDRYDYNATRSMDRTRSDDPGGGSRFGGDHSGTDMPSICNEGPPQFLPELIFTTRINKRFGFGIGLVAPAAVGHTKFGSTTPGNEGVGDNGLPAPSRYMLIEEELLIFYPTVGVGYTPHPAVSIGAAFGWGIAPILKFTTITRAIRGEDFSGDVLTRLDASDFFVPRITGSVHVVPHDRVDIVASFMWQDDLRANGDISLTTGHYNDAILDELTVSDTTVHAPQPWQAGLSFRYGHRLNPRAEDANAQARLTGRVEDPMVNERFDIELGLVYEMNARVDTFGVNLPVCPMPGGVDSPCDANGRWKIAVEGLGPLGVPSSLELEHQWRDQLSLRLGGDYNFVPGVFSARAGFSYETQGVKDGFAQLDFMPFQRFGLHAGITVRLGFFDISVSYAHIFQSTVIVNEDQASLHQVNAESRLGELDCDCDTSLRENRVGRFGEGTLINAGRFTSNFDIVSLGLTYHFR